MQKGNELDITPPGDGSSTPDETIQCPGCGRSIIAGLPYCPYCCGDDGGRGEVTRGAFLGGVFGLLAGGLVTAVWASIIGPENAPWVPALTITLSGGVLGGVAGAIMHRAG